MGSGGPKSQFSAKSNEGKILSKARERSDRALGSVENCVCLSLIDSEMAGPIGQKTWWDDRGHAGECPREG